MSYAKRAAEGTARRRRRQSAPPPKETRPNLPSQLCLPLLTPDEYGIGLHPAPRRHTVLLWAPAKSRGAWQKVRPSQSDDDLIAAIQQHVAQPDRYISVNQFAGWRTVRLLRSLRACYVDLDRCRSIDQAVMACDDLGLPAPSYAVASGCGVHLYWLIDPAPATALPAWQAIQAALVERFRDLGADPAAKDCTRVLRLAGSRHGVSGATVTAYAVKPGRYTLHGLADEVLGFRVPGRERDTRPERKRQKGKVKSLEARRASKARAKIGTFQLWHSRYLDLLMIAEHAADQASGYGIPEGHRDTMLFLLAVALSWFVPADRILDEIARQARTFTPSLPLGQAMAQMMPVVERALRAAAGEQDEYAGSKVDPRYRICSSTIRQMLGDLISPELEPHLRVLCSPERLAQRENQRQKNRDRVAEGRYKVRRGDFVATAAQRREMAVGLRAEGYKQVEIAEELGVSQPAVHYMLRAVEKI